MYKEGLKKAKEALKNSYSPYSKFKVGAALLLKNKQYVLGTNVENGSYGLSCCAERIALFKAYSNGYKKKDIDKIFVTAETNKPISPCGACRQVMFELMPQDSLVVLGCKLDEVKTLKVEELLPYGFSLDE